MSMKSRLREHGWWLDEYGHWNPPQDNESKAPTDEKSVVEELHA